MFEIHRFYESELSMSGSRNTLTPLSIRDHALLLSSEINAIGCRVAAILRQHQRVTRHIDVVTHYTPEQVRVQFRTPRTIYHQHTKFIDSFPLDGVAQLDLDTGVVYRQCASIFVNQEGEYYQGFHSLADAVAYQAHPTNELLAWLQGIHQKLIETYKHLENYPA